MLFSLKFKFSSLLPYLTCIFICLQEKHNELTRKLFQLKAVEFGKRLFVFYCFLFACLSVSVLFYFAKLVSWLVSDASLSNFRWFLMVVNALSFLDALVKLQHSRHSSLRLGHTQDHLCRSAEKL